MIEFHLGSPRQPLRRILCLGAHCDDIEIGCGGTILQLLSRRQDLEIHWVVFSSDSIREREARQAAALFLRGARRQNVAVHSFRNGFFPYIGAEIKDYFEELKGELDPDLIFTHCRHDLHQDHRTLCELTWNTFRHHLILEYEIVKFDGDLGTPSCYVPLSSSICRRKIQYLLKVFKSQADKPWFTSDAFQALMRIRGVECASPSLFAEGFYGRKVSLSAR